jgi:hypothetical protein
MKRTILWAAVVGIFLGMSTPATAVVVRITFDDVDGVATSLWDAPPGTGTVSQETFGGSNTGADPANRAYLTRPDENDGFPVALYRANLPANFAGATVNSATLVVRESFFNGGGPTTNVELRRINLPGATPWDPGDGTRGTRSTTPDNGAQMFWSDFDVAANNGIDWAGQAKAGPWDGGGVSGGSSTDFRTTALADLINSQTMGSGVTTTWNLTSLAQNWASGLWENDGFALSTLNAVGNTNGYQIDTSGTTDRGLFLDYTPVPEPASLSLLALGGLALLRRRSR